MKESFEIKVDDDCIVIVFKEGRVRVMPLEDGVAVDIENLSGHRVVGTWANKKDFDNAVKDHLRDVKPPE